MCSNNNYVYFIDIETENKNLEKQRFANVYIGITLERAIEIGVEYLTDIEYDSYEFIIKLYDPTTEMFKINSMYDDNSNIKYMEQYSKTTSLEEKYKLLLHYSNFFELQYTDKGKFIAAYYESPNHIHPLCNEILGGESRFKVGDRVNFINRKTDEVYPEVYEIVALPPDMTEYTYPLFCESGYELKLCEEYNYPDNIQQYFKKSEGIMSYHLINIQ